jgi:hypothetical protein
MLGRRFEESQAFAEAVEVERERIREADRPRREAEAAYAAQKRRWRARGESVALRQAYRGTILTSPSGIPGTATSSGYGRSTLLGGGDRLGV